MNNPYLEHYREQAAHQSECPGALGMIDGQPYQACTGYACRGRARQRHAAGFHDAQRHYSWAIPNDAALDAIAQCSPRGVVEIGAGGGYWTRLLRGRGVDVIAYDRAPRPGRWHTHNWVDDVLAGDHTAVAGHPERTLLLVWPAYGEAWTHQVIEAYGGDTVVYVGEGDGGATGDDRMHGLLGLHECWHDPDEDCDCRKEPEPFTPVRVVGIPQWFGLHDRLYVCQRVPGWRSPAMGG